MPTVKSTMNALEVTQTIGISLATLYRWLAESREAIANGREPVFPLNICTGGRKRRLIWSRDSITSFLNNQPRGSPLPAQPQSVADRKKRLTAALKDISAMER